jgi:hypothetical protein
MGRLYIEGERSVGRFSVASTRRSGTQENETHSAVPTLSSTIELGIEIDLQTVQCS